VKIFNWLKRLFVRDAFPRMSGKYLDYLGTEYNVSRRPFLWLFREPDRIYRRRIERAVKGGVDR
jgi:hypothetical protein